MEERRFARAAVVSAGLLLACGSSSSQDGSSGSSSGQGGAASSTTAASSGHGGASSSSTAATGSSSTGGGASGGAPPLGNGKTYYVDPSGDDGNPGTSQKPWLTIQQAGSVLQTGDTVIVRAGRYAGAVFCYDGPNQGKYGTFAGAANNPVTFEADPSAARGAVVIQSANDKTPAGFDLEPGCDYVNVVGFTFDNSHDFSMSDAGLRVNGDGDVIADNVVRYVDCTSVPSDHLDAAGKAAGGKGFGVIMDNVAGVVLEGNDVSFTCGDGDSGHGIYLSGSSSGAVIRRNSFHDNGALGIHINGDPDVVTNALIDANAIFQNGGNGINADGLQSSTIQNNIIYGNDKDGITLYQIDAGSPSQDDVIVNNTIVQPSSTDAAVRLATDDNPTTNIVVFNNILVGGKNGAFDDDDGSTCTSDYNITAGSPNSGDASNDTHSIALSPSAIGFTNLAGNDYHLASGSKAIDAGAGSLAGKDAPAFDFDGNKRPNGAAFDVGAFER